MPIAIQFDLAGLKTCHVEQVFHFAQSRCDSSTSVFNISRLSSNGRSADSSAKLEAVTAIIASGVLKSCETKLAETQVVLLERAPAIVVPRRAIHRSAASATSVAQVVSIRHSSALANRCRSAGATTSTPIVCREPIIGTYRAASFDERSVPNPAGARRCATDFAISELTFKVPVVAARFLTQRAVRLPQQIGDARREHRAQLLGRNAEQKFTTV